MKEFNKHIQEYIIEFAWQIGDNLKMPRAESRHRIIEIVQQFVEENEDIPDEDIDEFIAKFIELRGFK